jgi:hypothetical protein
VEFALGFWDLSLWLAVTAMILLITSELLSPYYSRTGVLLNRRRLRVIALIVASLFLVTVAYRAYAIIVLSKP